MTKKGRGSTFSHAELDVLLSIVEERLPFGQEAWERVGEEFRGKMTNSSVVRDNESLPTIFRSAIDLRRLIRRISRSDKSAKKSVLEGTQFTLYSL